VTTPDDEQAAKDLATEIWTEDAKKQGEENK
jgi:hypothetical protein